MNVDIEFMDLIQAQGMDKVDAYLKCFPSKCEGKTEEEVADLADKRFKRKDNLTYYEARQQELSVVEKEKMEWNIEVANKKMMKMLDHLEKKVYDDSNEKMAVLATVTNLYKELNLINGVNVNDKKFKENPIIFVGLDQLKKKKIDDEGNIIDVECEVVNDSSNNNNSDNVSSPDDSRDDERKESKD
jgi:hypothetical protein